VADRVKLYRSYLKYLRAPVDEAIPSRHRPFKGLEKTIPMQEILSVKYQDTIMYTFGFWVANLQLHLCFMHVDDDGRKVRHESMPNLSWSYVDC
jgi:hypothetical protein